MSTELPNGVVIVDGADDPGTLGLAYGSSVDNLIGTILDNRQIQTFKWSNAAGRTEQEGMGGGDVGYQGDIKEYYRFDATLADWVPVSLDQTLVVSDTASFALTSTYQQITTWATEDRRAGGAPALAAGTFTATRAGWYDTSVFIQVAIGSSVNSEVEIRHNGNKIAGSTTSSTGSLGNATTVSMGVYLAVSDTLEVWGARTSGNITNRRWTIRRVGY